MKKITKALMDGYFPPSLLAKDLGLDPSNFRSTTLDKVTFKNVVLIRIPLSAMKFIESDDYTATLVDIDEDEMEYDYVLPISKKKKIGFWE